MSLVSIPNGVIYGQLGAGGNYVLDAVGEKFAGVGYILLGRKIHYGGCSFPLSSAPSMMEPEAAEVGV